MSMPAQPFTCTVCSSQLKSDFSIFEPTDDWLIAFPEKQLIHIHFGKSTDTDDLSLQEAQFHYDWLQRVVQRYPQKKFFFVADFSRKDDSEFVTPEANKIYKQIRSHPQLAAGAISGQTRALQEFTNLLLWLGGVHTTFVNTVEAAQLVYQKWLNKQDELGR